MKNIKVVTHQRSGDPAIAQLVVAKLADIVVTHQHSGDPAISRSYFDIFGPVS